MHTSGIRIGIAFIVPRHRRQLGGMAAWLAGGWLGAWLGGWRVVGRRWLRCGCLPAWLPGWVGGVLLHSFA